MGFYAGYAAGSGSFNNALSTLRTAGLVEGWQVTAAGAELVEAAGVQPKPTGNDLREWLRPKLSKAENTFLDALIEAGGEALTMEQLAERTGYANGSGSFNSAVSRLRSIEAAIGYAKDGGARAAEVFF